MTFNVVFSKFCPPFRLVIWLMIFTSVWFCYMLRINISIIILAMAEPARNNDNTTNIPECKKEPGNLTLLTPNYVQTTYHGPRYVWSPQLQGVILGAYFYGYIAAGLPCGYLSEKFGPRKCIMCSFALAAILTLITPWAARDPILLIVVRVLTGAVGAMSYGLMCYVHKSFLFVSSKQ